MPLSRLPDPARSASPFLPGRLLRLPALALVLALPAAELPGQFKFREPPARERPPSLSTEAGMDIWERFRQARQLGSFRIEGHLLHRPAGEPSRRYKVLLEGDWTADRETTRLRLSREGRPLADQVLERLPEGRLLAGPPGGPMEPVDRGFLDTPVTPSLPFAWRDLLMPFLSWSPPAYLGPERYLGRPAHRFELRNPDPLDSPARVEVVLDADFAALLEAELLDPGGRLYKRVRVGGFRQFADGWMFSELNWEHRPERQSVRLEVGSFSLP